MKREDIDKKYKWDLTTIFNSDENWQKEYEMAAKEINEITKFKGKITKTSDNLLEYLKVSERIERRLYKLYYYSNLKKDENTANNKYQEMYGKILNLFKEYSSISSFVSPEILNTDESIIKKYINENKELKEYEFQLKDDFRYKKHILSESEEKLLRRLTNALSASEKAYTSLIYSDIKFDKIKDENGKTKELNESNYSVYISSRNRNVRKNAFKNLYKTYIEHKNVISSLFDSYLETMVEMSKIRKFNTSLEKAMYSDNIDVSVYDNLMKAVNDNLKTIYKYYKFKRKVLKIKDLHIYDIYTPLVNDYDKKYTYEEAKELVLNALKPLGEEYQKILNKAFDERWIDVYFTKGKYTGAYSSGNYDTNPFILLNFENDLKSVSTLAHELGHSMHTYFSCKNNSYVNSQYKIFVAEVASTVNEILLNKYLIDNSNDINEKLYALNELLELYKGTIYRQTMFAEFEKEVYGLKEKGETLTSEILCNLYYDLNKKYFGSDVIIDEEIKYEWERIPHFYYNYYVYKYATSLSISSKIANDIYYNNEGIKEKYLKFLSLGGSDYPLNELKTIDIDASKPDIITDACKTFDELIDEFDKIYKLKKVKKK